MTWSPAETSGSARRPPRPGRTFRTAESELAIRLGVNVGPSPTSQTATISTLMSSACIGTWSLTPERAECASEGSPSPRLHNFMQLGRLTALVTPYGGTALEMTG